MTINWNRGEEAAAVANRFLAMNNLPVSHLEDTVNFVRQAMANPGAAANNMGGAGGGGGGGAGYIPGGGGGGGGQGGGRFDYSYPVEVMDGRRLTILF